MQVLCDDVSYVWGLGGEIVCFAFCWGARRGWWRGGGGLEKW